MKAKKVIVMSESAAQSSVLMILRHSLFLYFEILYFFVNFYPFVSYTFISPAHSNPFFAAITAITSLMTAAAAIVPWTIYAHPGAGPLKTETAIPVNTSETPE